ncbi:MAG: class I SAM-dependent methyltransferase [Planctomycetia bacterium]|nr:class I SAM-dependent methyltransferase [Planctomycetia bacterium]
MNDQVFGRNYAEQYDRIYAAKNYEAECDLLEAALRRFGAGAVESILDLGCGTGNHAFVLGRRGKRVTAVDRSAEMLNQARDKAARASQTSDSPVPVFVQGDVRTVALEKTFDAVIMMFAVLGYQVANSDVTAALATVRRHLRPGGLFLFDAWYGPAVLSERPTTQVKEFPLPGGKLIRIASATLDTTHHTAKVQIRTLKIGESAPASDTIEIHDTRYFFPQELAQYLTTAGFQLLHMSAFPQLDRPPDQSSWNVFVVARAE